jgi:hypothetical protein
MLYIYYTIGLKWLIKLADKMKREMTYPLAHREKANTETKPVTSFKSNLWLPDDGPYEVRNMLECILEF